MARPSAQGQAMTSTARPARQGQRHGCRGRAAPTGGSSTPTPRSTGRGPGRRASHEATPPPLARIDRDEDGRDAIGELLDRAPCSPAPPGPCGRPATGTCSRPRRSPRTRRSPAGSRWRRSRGRRNRLLDGHGLAGGQRLVHRALLRPRRRRRSGSSRPGGRPSRRPRRARAIGTSTSAPSRSTRAAPGLQRQQRLIGRGGPAARLGLDVAAGEVDGHDHRADSGVVHDRGAGAQVVDDRRPRP